MAKKMSFAEFFKRNATVKVTVISDDLVYLDSLLPVKRLNAFDVMIGQEVVQYPPMSDGITDRVLWCKELCIEACRRAKMLKALLS